MNVTVDLTEVLKSAVDKMSKEQVFLCIVVSGGLIAYKFTLDYKRDTLLASAA